WNFIIYPQYDQEQNEIFYSKNELEAFRLTGGVGARLFDHHQFNLSTNFSYINYDNKYIKGIKSVLSYFYKGFSLGGTLQYNPYNVNDLSFVNSASNNFLDYNLYSSYHLNLS